MDVPTPINYQNTQINSCPRENEQLININGVLTQILYKDSLNEKEKKNMNKKIIYVVVVEKDKINIYVKFLYYI